jgi:hypothetical protein
MGLPRKRTNVVSKAARQAKTAAPGQRPYHAEIAATANSNASFIAIHFKRFFWSLFMLPILPRTAAPFPKILEFKVN